MWRYGAVVLSGQGIGATFAHWQLTDSFGMFRLSRSLETFFCNNSVNILCFAHSVNVPTCILSLY